HAGGPVLVVPTTLGEGSPQEGKSALAPRASEARPTAPAPSAAPATAPPDGARASADSVEPAAARELAGAQAPPDPEPLRQKEQWEYSVEWKAGALTVTGVRPVDMKRPVVTPRRMGRYAIELWIGRELVERVRFDLPLLGAEGPEAAGVATRFPPPNIAKGAHVRARVLVPRAARARRALLIDRATGEAIALPWPPDQAGRPAAAASNTEARPHE